MTYNIAVVGSTGAVGREILQTLYERDFPIDNVYALASSKSPGRQVSFGDERTIDVQPIEDFDFSKVDFAFFSAGGDVSEKYAPLAGKNGALVIDNSSAFRMTQNVPLIVPEVNHYDLKGCLSENGGMNIIANPNCSTAQLVMALCPLHREFIIKRAVVATYQAVSGAGKEAMDELFNQTKKIYVNDPLEKNVFTKEISFNLIPHIDVFLDDGFTKEEVKMRDETKKILDENVDVVAHCVRVPVFVGHSEAVFIECENPMDEEVAREVLTEMEGVIVIDHRADEGYITPKEAAGEDGVYISRIRRDESVPSGLVFWCVSDNLRKGAALNAVQIAELAISQGIK